MTAKRITFCPMMTNIQNRLDYSRGSELKSGRFSSSKILRNHQNGVSVRQRALKSQATNQEELLINTQQINHSGEIEKEDRQDCLLRYLFNSW